MQRCQKRNAGKELSLIHIYGIVVSNLAYAVASELGLEQESCYELAVAGMLHDIGKLKLTEYINGRERDPLLIEELKYVRMHSTLGLSLIHI